MFERFTDRARRVVVLSQEEARKLGHNYIGTEHLVLGLVAEGDGVAAQALEALGVQLEQVREQVERIIGRGEGQDPGHIPFTPRAKKVLELSLREALQLSHNYIGTEHILLGLIREGEGVGAQVLVSLGADLTRVRQQVIVLLQGRGAPEPLTRRPFWRRRRTSAGSAPDVLFEAGPPGALDVGLEQMSDAVLLALIAARAEVRRLRAPELEPEHLLAGLLTLGDDPATTALRAAGLRLDGVRSALERAVERGAEEVAGVPELAPSTWRVLEAATLGAGQTPAISTTSLLRALLELSSAVRQLVTSARGDLEGLKNALDGGESTGG